MSHLGEALRRYTCGPLDHQFELRGSSPDDVSNGDWQDDSPIAVAGLNYCLKCGLLEQAGFCGFCDDPMELTCEVVSPNGRVAEIPVCGHCHRDLSNSDDSGDWSLLRTVAIVGFPE
jgi:hypothetical protein